MRLGVHKIVYINNGIKYKYNIRDNLDKIVANAF